jgi:hypothetical protein
LGLSSDLDSGLDPSPIQGMADPTAASAPAHLKTPGYRWLLPVMTGLLILFCLAMAGRGLGNPY